MGSMTNFFQKGYFYVSREGYEKYEAEIVAYAEKIERSLSKEIGKEKSDFGTVYTPSEAQFHRQILEQMKEKLENVIVVPDFHDNVGVSLGDIVTVRYVTSGYEVDYKITGDMELPIELMDADVIEVNLNSPIVRKIYGQNVGTTLTLESAGKNEKIEIENVIKPKVKRK